MQRFLAALTVILSAFAHGEGASLCQKSEAEIFQCMVGRKSLSICASSPFSNEAGYVQYRYGVPGRIELQYPAAHVPPHGKFWFSSTGYSGGGEARLRFEASGVQYTVFDRTVRTAFGSNGNEPDFVAGVGIKAPGRKDKTLKCTTEGSIKAAAHEPGAFESEPFNSDYRP